MRPNYLERPERAASSSGARVARLAVILNLGIAACARHVGRYYGAWWWARCRLASGYSTQISRSQLSECFGSQSQLLARLLHVASPVALRQGKSVAAAARILTTSAEA